VRRTEENEHGHRSRKTFLKLSDRLSGIHNSNVRTTYPRTPADDVKTFDAVTTIVPLRIGSYENVTFHSQAGVQKFRPVSGSHLGDSSQVFDFPVVELTFSIPYDEASLKDVIDRIFEIHIAEEPVIYIDEGWSTRSKSYSEKSNPNRFWNRSQYKDASDW
jgi:hypothetical protein